MEITIHISEVLASQAASSGLPAEAYVERLLDRIAAASVARDESRDALRGELLADWEQYKTTGLHLDEEEVDTWLARLESGEDAEPPELHT